MLIGVISDTHGLLRTKVQEVFKGTDVIFHGGDIGGIEILKSLEEIAPVIAVRGNCDRDDWSKEIPVKRCIEIGGCRFLVIHNLNDLKSPPKPWEAIVFGHSHQAKVFLKNEILYLNPGSAGPRRFRLPVTVARIRIEKGIMQPEVIQL